MRLHQEIWCGAHGTLTSVELYSVMECGIDLDWFMYTNVSCNCHRLDLLVCIIIDQD